VGSRRKGLGFSLCAVPSRMAVLVFQSWAELSQDGVRAESRTRIEGSRIRGGGKSELESESESESELELELESESEGLRRCQNFAKSVEDRIRLLDSIFELKIIHARK
jgi:hypothetical protein